MFLLQKLVNVWAYSAQREQIMMASRCFIVDVIVILVSWLVIIEGNVQTEWPHNTNVMEPSCPLPCTCSAHFKEVNCTDKQLFHIPAGIPTNVTVLQLGYNILREIPARAFANLVSLTHLELNNNRIGRVDDSAFVELHNLIDLTLNKNKISKLSPAVFGQTRKIQRLVLTRNLLESIPDLSNVTALIQLDLDNNPNLGSALFPLGFSNLRNLSTINLSNNPLLVAIRTTDFMSLHKPSIRSINLVSCHLVSVDKDVFKFPYLQSLLLADTKLNEQSLRNIFNSISSFPKPELNSLDLSGVFRRQTIPADLFSDLYKVPIKTLNLKRSQLDHIVNGTFDYFPSLELLDLQNSQIEIIDYNVFSQNLSSIKELRLQNVQLDVIPKMNLPTLQVFSNMYFYYNIAGLL